MKNTLTLPIPAAAIIIVIGLLGPILICFGRPHAAKFDGAYPDSYTSAVSKYGEPATVQKSYSTERLNEIPFFKLHHTVATWDFSNGVLSITFNSEGAPAETSFIKESHQ